MSIISSQYKQALPKSIKILTNISLKNKIFLSTLFVIMAISAIIALLSRWILVSSLTSELELRGIAIAHSIAERGAAFVLGDNQPRLLSLIFDEARLRERQHLIAYIFITDEHDQVLSHTFTRSFPRGLELANKLEPEDSKRIKLVHFEDQSAYDIALPMKEGLYIIGAVHVGLSKKHIDNLVSKLRFTFLGFISLVIIIIFIISHWLARHISMPLAKLTAMSDELSRGNFDIILDPWGKDINWTPEECPSYTNSDLNCWTPAPALPESSELMIEAKTCHTCAHYTPTKGDEVIQLADSFKNMIQNIKFYRRKLRESEEKYRSLFDNGPDPIFVISGDTFEILDANPRALEVYEYTREELQTLSFLELSPEHTDTLKATFKDIDNMSSGVYFPKLVHYKKGLKAFFVSVHACRISYLAEPAIITSITDITEIIEKDTQLIQAGKMKVLGEMSAGIAHELNQPLNAIKMGSEYLAMVMENGAQAPAEELKMVANEISAQVSRASEIINALRAFGRKADPVMEQVNINKSIMGVLSIVRRQFELQQIKFERELTDPIPPIIAQDNRLQQVFFNLISNAKDAINELSRNKLDAKRNIIIRTYHRDGFVYAEVSDTGIGIPDSIRDKIFEPFFTTKNTSLDMGLGLAITKSIVKDFRGKIHIDSTLGVGTTFTLCFPAIDQ